jgi:hypothetical protein
MPRRSAQLHNPESNDVPPPTSSSGNIITSLPDPESQSLSDDPNLNSSSNTSTNANLLPIATGSAPLLQSITTTATSFRETNLFSLLVGGTGNSVLDEALEDLQASISCQWIGNSSRILQNLNGNMMLPQGLSNPMTR